MGCFRSAEALITSGVKKIPADVTGGDVERATVGDHGVGKVLADSHLFLDDFVGVSGDDGGSRHVFEITVN